MKQLAPHPKDIVCGSGFSPPELVAIACVMVGAGLGILVIGSAALRLPGGIQLSTGMELAKGLLGLIVAASGVGLYLLTPWSRNAIRVLVFFGGVLPALYGWEANPLRLAFFEKLTTLIDWEFAWTARGAVFLTSAVILAYLSRPSVAWTVENGGEPGYFEGYVCAGCGQELAASPEHGCDVCGGPFYEQYRSISGVSYLREFGGE